MPDIFFYNMKIRMTVNIGASVIPQASTILFNGLNAFCSNQEIGTIEIDLQDIRNEFGNVIFCQEGDISEIYSDSLIR